MHPALDQFRLAVTVIDTEEALLPILGELLNLGLESAQIGLMARATTLSGLVASTPAPDGVLGRIARLFDTWQDVPGAEPGLRALTTSVPLFRLLQQAWITGLGTRSGSSSKSKPEQDITAHIANGGIALVVSAKDTKQQLLVTRQLLARSARRVTTFEFRLPGSDVEPKD